MNAVHSVSVRIRDQRRVLSAPVVDAAHTHTVPVRDRLTHHLYLYRRAAQNLRKKKCNHSTSAPDSMIFYLLISSFLCRPSKNVDQINNNAFKEVKDKANRSRRARAEHSPPELVHENRIMDFTEKNVEKQNARPQHIRNYTIIFLNSPNSHSHAIGSVCASRPRLRE